MAHAEITKADGSSESITEFNGGIAMELDQRTALSMEVTVLNKNFSVFFSFIPRLYYVLPWRLRLIPEVHQNDDEYLEEIECLDEEEVKEIEAQEAQVGSTQLEAAMSFANSNMWLLGFQHILSRNLSLGYNFDTSLIPVRNARIQRYRNCFMLRHDISKEAATRLSYTNTKRVCK